MEQKIKEGFDTLHMSEECVDRIQAALAAQRAPKNRWRPAVAAAAACLALALVAVCTPVGRAAVEVVKETFQSLLGPGHTVTEQYTFEGGSVVDEVGYDDKTGQKYIAGYWDGSFPSWLEAGEEGLWFVGNGQYFELTSLIDLETPFTYEYTENGITYHLAVGGVYDPARSEDLLAGIATELGFGWGAWMSKETAEGTQWIGGYAKGLVDRDGNEYTWVSTAKEELNIPW